MPSDKLTISLAGNLPYYKPSSKFDFWGRIGRYFWTYRTKRFNDPSGKTGMFFFQGLAEYHRRGGRDIQVKCWGNIAPDYIRVLKELDIDDIVEIGGFIPKTRSLDALRESDVLLLTLALGTNGHRPFSLPGKMFDYFLLEKPILAPVQESQCADILKKSGLGLVVDPLDKEAIADQLENLVNNKQHLDELFQVDRSFLEQFNTHNLVNGMAAIFDHL